MAAQYGNEPHCIFEQVDADEGEVPQSVDMSQGMILHRGRPFEIPPELGCGTVTSRGCEARVAACHAVWDSGYEVRDRACLGGMGRGQCLLDEMEVAAEIAADVVEENAAVDQPCGCTGIEGTLGGTIGGWWHQAYRA